MGSKAGGSQKARNLKLQVQQAMNEMEDGRLSTFETKPLPGVMLLASTGRPLAKIRRKAAKDVAGVLASFGLQCAGLRGSLFWYMRARWNVA